MSKSVSSPTQVIIQDEHDGEHADQAVIGSEEDKHKTMVCTELSGMLCSNSIRVTSS